MGAGGSSRAEVKNEWSYISAPPIPLHLSTKKGHHRPKQRKGDTRFGTWNVRSLYRAGSLTAAARELARCKLDLVGVQEVNDIKHTVLHTAEQLVPEPSAFEVELAIDKLKSHKSPGTDQIPAELIKAGDRTIHHIISIWNKDELPEEWKESIIVPIYMKGDKTDCSNYRGISICQLRTKCYPTSSCQD